MKRFTHRPISTLLAAVVCNVLCACESARPQANSRAEAPVSTAPSPSTSAQLSVSGGNLSKLVVSNDQTARVLYATMPETITVNEPFAIELRVDVLDGHGANDLALNIDAGMPEHAHGMNVEPTVTSLGHNMFRIDNMVFHMAGRWEMYFDVTRDGVTSRAQDEITLE